MKIILSKAQWEMIGKRAGWIDGPHDDNSLRVKSQKWWSGLSINQMKELTRKYYPDPHITWSFISDTPGLVEDIYQKESQIDMADDMGEQKKQLDRSLGRPE